LSKFSKTVINIKNEVAEVSGLMIVLAVRVFLIVSPSEATQNNENHQDDSEVLDWAISD